MPLPSSVARLGWLRLRDFSVGCCDPKDDKFLEVALNGRADVIIAGDARLLEMHPWREIDILTPTDYLRPDFGDNRECQ